MTEPTSGSQNRRTLVVVSDDEDPRVLQRELVAHYRARGWPLDAPVDDDDKDPGRGDQLPSAASAYVDGWLLSISLGQDWDDDLQRSVPTGDIRIELSHEPTDDRGCHNG